MRQVRDPVPSRSFIVHSTTSSLAQKGHLNLFASVMRFFVCTFRKK